MLASAEVWGKCQGVAHCHKLPNRETMQEKAGGGSAKVPVLFKDRTKGVKVRSQASICEGMGGAQMIETAKVLERRSTHLQH